MNFLSKDSVVLFLVVFAIVAIGTWELTWWCLSHIRIVWSW